jgi:hypothetical protein
MIQVRLVFQAKFGRAGELAAIFKEFGSVVQAAELARPRSVRILTDLSGPFDTVVQELEFDSFETWQENQAAVFANPRAQESLAHSRDLIAGGHKEFYTIEA